MSEKISKVCIFILFICLTIEVKVAPPSPLWTQLSPSNSPSARTAASMAFDPSMGQLILFGGFDGSEFSDDTWNWAITLPLAIATPSSQTNL